MPPHLDPRPQAHSLAAVGLLLQEAMLTSRASLSAILGSRFERHPSMASRCATAQRSTGAVSCEACHQLYSFASTHLSRKLLLPPFAGGNGMVACTG